jgi:hypothetical protein
VALLPQAKSALGRWHCGTALSVWRQHVSGEETMRQTLRFDFELAQPESAQDKPATLTCIFEYGHP